MRDFKAKIKKYFKKRNLPLFCGISASIIAVSWLFFDTFLGFITSPFVFIAVYPEFENDRRENESKALRNEFRDVLYSFSSSFSSGRHMQEAMREAKRYLNELYGETSILAPEIGKMYNMISSFGMDETKVWRAFAEDKKIEDITDFIEVYEACRASGGNIIVAVDNAASIITEKIGIENEIRKMASQKKTEGRIIAVMPFILIIFLRISAPEYIGIMYKTVAGRIMMMIACILITAAAIMTERITRINV